MVYRVSNELETKVRNQQHDTTIAGCCIFKILTRVQFGSYTERGRWILLITLHLLSEPSLPTLGKGTNHCEKVLFVKFRPVLV